MRLDAVTTALKTANARRALGLRAATATLLVEGMPVVSARLQRLMGRPIPYDLRQYGTVATSGQEAASHVAGDAEWSPLLEEYADLEERLAKRRTAVTLRYPDFFPVEKETGRMLYLATRVLRPKCVVETGVADGLSTSVILAALHTNGDGELHSFDVADDVGALVEDRDSWTLHVARRSPETTLSAVVANVPPIDMFFHDADHRFLNQLFEYETVAFSAAPGALIASDDVNHSYAFDTFCRRRGRRPVYLLDSEKVSGFVRL